ncbi:MAG: enoyl-CoA hydratase/isomerase family protein [Gammaproteobacteria bacterium]
MSENQDLLLERDGEVVTVILNRPDARNALTFDMYSGLAEICAAPPEGAKAIIVRGAGDKAFAAGTDIRQFRHFNTAGDAINYEQKIDWVLDTIETCPVPTIAAISGACTGGGAMIAAVCDLRVCNSSLKFGFPIARTLGNTLSAQSLARLSALVGASRVREIIFTSRLIEADEAKQVGIVSEVLDGPSDLLSRAGDIARVLTTQAPLTLRATKILQHRLLKQSVDDHDMLLLCYQSDDFKHGLEAFLDKRKPEWKGE